MACLTVFAAFQHGSILLRLIPVSSFHGLNGAVTTDWLMTNTAGLVAERIHQSIGCIVHRQCKPAKYVTGQLQLTQSHLQHCTHGAA